MDNKNTSLSNQPAAPRSPEQSVWATLEEMKQPNARPTPAMARFIELKTKHPEYLLFYRMGDFYELFFEDAISVSNALNLTLTSRSKHNDKEIPMCGVPFHAYEVYLARLIKMGYKVAICEQTEDDTPTASPSENEKKSSKPKVMNREIVRFVTPGTITEDTLLDAKLNNYIACCYVRSAAIGVAWLDISTGAFCMQRLQTDKAPAPSILSATLARVSPAELLIEDRLLEYPQFYSLMGEYKDQLSVRPSAVFNLESATETLLKAYNIKTLSAFGDFSKHELIAAGVLLSYVENTQRGHLPKLEMPRHIIGEDLMEIDSSTRRSLELLSPASTGGTSLLKVMDRTVTGIGARLLAERLASPILNIKEINDRLDAVNFFLDNPEVRHYCREALRKCMDMERSVQRLSVGRGGPKDLFDLAQTLKMIPYVQSSVLDFANYQKDSIYAVPPSSLTRLVRSFFDHSALEYDIESMLLDERKDLPTLARNGGFIKQGASAVLDYLRQYRSQNDERCNTLREKYALKTGISALKIKSNNVLGYFVEVPAKSAEKLFNDPEFIHRQSVLNAVRFTTVELSELENEVNNSEEKALEEELTIFQELTDHVLVQADVIKRSAEILAALDVATSLAELAAENNYTRPVINDTLDFEIIEGRHPVVESVMKKESSGNFIGNTCEMAHGENRLWLLTGPNMAGKSTFLRQNALIAIMAQMGSFVPAKQAKIGLIDKLFSRVGASDDLARGRSTFMVEMVETAAILNQATNRSFVILDEIGRGTATFDGLSIAWSVLEQLYNINQSRTIFATHYHELTKLNQRLPALSLHCMKIKEFNGDVIFMHEVINGAADRSYGIHVAKLAGLPALTIKRAEQVLKLLENTSKNKSVNTIESDLPLFENLQKQIEPAKESPVITELKELDVDSLSPREALNKLYELKQKALK